LVKPVLPSKRPGDLSSKGKGRSIAKTEFLQLFQKQGLREGDKNKVLNNSASLLWFWGPDQLTSLFGKRLGYAPTNTLFTRVTKGPDFGSRNFLLEKKETKTDLSCAKTKFLQGSQPPQDLRGQNFRFLIILFLFFFPPEHAFSPSRCRSVWLSVGKKKEQKQITSVFFFLFFLFYYTRRLVFGEIVLIDFKPKIGYNKI
jgi:hypothetical protein